jgi:ATP-dependent RNA helicase RhlE
MAHLCLDSSDSRAFGGGSKTIVRGKFAMTTFADLNLAAPLLRALEAAGHTEPTPIQAQAIPSVLEGRDILGIAQTGTGKTAAFALPVLHRLLETPGKPPKKGCRVLVLSPTRELATQIAESFKLYGRFMRLSVGTIFGGVGYRPQIQTLQRGVDVLIATPGRLMDHLETGHADLSSTDIFVLDEADQMLDLGFLKPIQTIAAELAEPRHTLFFSATMPKQIAALADAFLDDPVKVSVTPAATTVERITQRVIVLDNGQKTSALADVLSADGMHRALVFTRTKRGADRVAKQLTTLKFEAAAIHGDKSQGQRERALKQFKASKIQILVATDIAARGIDVDAVSHVVNFDLPEVPEAYVHRIGRTGRAGAEGQAVSFCTPDDYDLLHAIEKATRQKIDSEDRRADQSEPIPDGSAPQQRKAGKSGNRNRGRGRGQRAAGGEQRRPQRGKSEGDRFDPTAPKPAGARQRGRGTSQLEQGGARIIDGDKPAKPARANGGAKTHSRGDASEATAPRRRRRKPGQGKPATQAGGQSRGQSNGKSTDSRAARKKRRAEAAATV